MNKDDIRKVRDALLNSAGHNPDCGLFTLNYNGNYLPCDCGINEALAILDAALADDEKPVAWLCKSEDGRVKYTTNKARGEAWSAHKATKKITPLYLHPSSDAKDAVKPADDSVVWHSVGELGQAIKDAARFRWLRDKAGIMHLADLLRLEGDRVDAYVDAVMKEVKP